MVVLVSSTIVHGVQAQLLIGISLVGWSMPASDKLTALFNNSLQIGFAQLKLVIGDILGMIMIMNVPVDIATDGYAFFAGGNAGTWAAAPQSQPLLFGAILQRRFLMRLLRQIPDCRRYFTKKFAHCPSLSIRCADLACC
ncbi:MAG: hypothetical protein R3F37_11530 [Candidatus Competibacteraceae bacterium]